VTFTNSTANVSLEVQQGTLAFTGTATQNLGQTVVFTNANLNMPTGTYTVNGGSFFGLGGGKLTGNLKVTGGSFYVGGNGIIGTFTVTNNYEQTGGTLYIDVDGTTGANKNDLLAVGNQAKLGGSLSVTTANGAPAAVGIITYTTRVGNFTNITYLGGVTCTVDLTTDPSTYKLVPNP
jgi:hypothetical protein